MIIDFAWQDILSIYLPTIITDPTDELKMYLGEKQMYGIDQNKVQDRE